MLLQRVCGGMSVFLVATGFFVEDPDPFNALLLGFLQG
jgi:hypothetical protein